MLRSFWLVLAVAEEKVEKLNELQGEAALAMFLFFNYLPL